MKLAGLSKSPRPLISPKKWVTNLKFGVEFGSRYMEAPPRPFREVFKKSDSSLSKEGLLPGLPTSSVSGRGPIWGPVQTWTGQDAGRTQMLRCDVAGDWEGEHRLESGAGAGPVHCTLETSRLRGTGQGSRALEWVGCKDRTNDIVLK